MKLKPCPFCGSDKPPKAIHAESRSDDYILATMLCQNCLAQSPKIWVRTLTDTELIDAWEGRSKR